MKFYDIIPPEEFERRKRELERNKSFNSSKKHGFGINKNPILKIITVLLIITLNRTGLSSVMETSSYFSNTEVSSGNSYIAGDLDFELLVSENFTPFGYSEASFIYDKKPDSAYIDEGTMNVSDILCSCQCSLSVDTSDGEDHYIYMNWDLGEDISDYTDTDYFNLQIQHKESDTIIKVELKNQGGEWIEVCDPGEYGYFAWDTCDLTSYIDILKAVSPNIEMRIVAHKTGNCHEYLKCAKLQAKLFGLEEIKERSVKIINNGNIHKYTASASDFQGGLCDYLVLEANLDGGASEYLGNLINFIYGPIVFEDPEEWLFALTLPTSTPESVIGESCDFNFVFFGSQVRNDLPFGQGFNDTEQVDNSVSSQFPDCKLRLTKTTTAEYVSPGEEVIYHLTLDNIGTKVCTGGGVKLRDIFDNSLQYISYTSTRTPKNFSQACNYLEWNFGSIYPEDPLIGIDLTMGVKNTAQCDSTIINSAKYWSDQTDWGDLVSALIEVICQPKTGILINEFLPNPAGSDGALMPDGEWVELYNNSGADLDVAGWWLYDNKNTHELEITNLNTDTGSTLIPNGGFMVVYRDGDLDFALNNTGGDSVRLFDGPTGSGNLIDSYAYNVSAPEGKSFARVPDGSPHWVDPIPTPGEPNILEGEGIVFGEAVSEDDENIEDEQELILLQSPAIENIKSIATDTEEILIENNGTSTEETSTTEELITGEQNSTTEELIIEDNSENESSTPETLNSSSFEQEQNNEYSLTSEEEETPAVSLPEEDNSEEQSPAVLPPDDTDNNGSDLTGGADADSGDGLE
jgi:uncharacterized repeat protein (TIGR01451 family)